MKRCLLVACSSLVLSVLLFAGVSVAGEDGDTNLGTWKLNLAKSIYHPGPAPKSQTRTYEPFEGDGVKYRIETVNADGSRTTGGYSAHYDGKDYPTTANVFAGADSTGMKRIDAYTVDNWQKRAGKVVQTNRRVVSKDGKTMTITQKGTTPSGQPFNNVLVFDKQ